MEDLYEQFDESPVIPLTDEAEEAAAAASGGDEASAKEINGTQNGNDSDSAESGGLDFGESDDEQAEPGSEVAPDAAGSASATASSDQAGISSMPVGGFAGASNTALAPATKPRRPSSKKAPSTADSSAVKKFKVKVADVLRYALKPHLDNGAIADKEAFKALARKMLQAIVAHEEKRTVKGGDKDARWRYSKSTTAPKIRAHVAKYFAKKGLKPSSKSAKTKKARRSGERKRPREPEPYVAGGGGTQGGPSPSRGARVGMSAPPSGHYPANPPGAHPTGPAPHQHSGQMPAYPPQQGGHHGGAWARGPTAAPPVQRPPPPSQPPRPVGPGSWLGGDPFSRQNRAPLPRHGPPRADWAAPVGAQGGHPGYGAPPHDLFARPRGLNPYAPQQEPPRGPAWGQQAAASSRQPIPAHGQGRAAPPPQGGGAPQLQGGLLPTPVKREAIITEEALEAAAKPSSPAPDAGHWGAEAGISAN